MIAVLILVPLLGACAVRLIGSGRKQTRDLFMRAVTFACFALSVYLLICAGRNKEYALELKNVCGMTLTFRADFFRALYVCIAAFMWFETTLMSRAYFAHYHNRTRYYFFNQLTLCGVMGVFLANDLYTAFIFFELMSLSSYPWVAHEESAPAMRAAATYLAIAVLGGMVTLMGLMLMYSQTSTLAYESLASAPKTSAVYTASALILFGFLAKAGAFPLHIWLPKAHPVAPAPASALLSGMLTKVGVLGVIVVSYNIFSGSQVYGCILLALALTTMLTGAVLGVFSVNLKRTLACSSMSQIGYILTGIASGVLMNAEGGLASAGALTHMINHSLLKLTLFMSAGVVYMNAHTLDLDALRGFGRKKPLLHICYLTGALGLMGVPGFNGYISKTMIHEGLVELAEESGLFAFRVCEWVFLFAAGLTTAYMLKTYICIFIQKNRDSKTQARYDACARTYADAASRTSLLLSALLIPLLGCVPHLLLRVAAGKGLAFFGQSAPEDIAFFSLKNLAGGAVTLIIGTLVYVLFVRRFLCDEAQGYTDRWPKRLDLEELVYRPLFCRLLPDALGAVCRVLSCAGDFAAATFTKALAYVCGVIEKTGDAFAHAFSVIIAFLSRVFESATDMLALFLKETLFTDHSHDLRSKAHGLADRLRRHEAAVQQELERLKPQIRPDPREVTDLRYGSYFTNTVTFGLIICTIGIVFAFVYVLLKMK